MEVRFSKMHGLGNDFMVVDQLTQSVPITPELIRRWGDRHRGVGFDQFLVVEPPSIPDADFRYRIFNQDGSEVEHCGNGARCFAIYVRRRGLSPKSVLRVQTAKGQMVLEIKAKQWVKVDMGEPDFTPASLPFNPPQQQTHYELQADDHTVTVGAVSVGNPHAVIEVNDVNTAPIQTLGQALEHHAAFPNRVNVGFMQLVDRRHIRLRVFERGVGETEACGTGACAAVAIARLWDRVDDEVTVSLRGGELEFHWAGQGHPLFMTGPTAHVYEGRITL